MLSKYLECFSQQAMLDEIFEQNAIVTLNSTKTVKGLANIQLYYQQYKEVFRDFAFRLVNLYLDTPNGYSFNWEITGIHGSVLLGYLPTQKRLKFCGHTTLLLQNGKISAAHHDVNLHDLEAQICHTSENILQCSEVANDLTGPAQNIYKLILSSRAKLTDSKQILVNALRNSTLRAPDLSLLNPAIISSLHATTSLTRTRISHDAGESEVFIYAPATETNNADLPVILYLHGGGWCIGSPENYDLVNRKLALATHARVICPRYRLCPEHPYPAGFDDCCGVYQYCRSLPSTNSLYINPAKIIVAGDSVGGTFSAALTLRMQVEGQLQPNAVILLSPATDMRLENYHSYNHLTHNNIMMDQGLIGFIRGCYIQGDQWDDPFVSPMRGDLSCFPKTFMMIGEADPLFDENLAFSKKLQNQSAHGCQILLGKGMPHHYHTFLGMADEVELAYQAIANFINTVI